ncbi:MAG TPA: hypothetical protein VGP72_04570 [Planctomycetota bacterium]|jgi:iron(III) transport system permease protein
MSRRFRAEHLAQTAVAALILLPLLAAFLGQGGLADAYSADDGSGALSARRWTLAAACGRSLLIGMLAMAGALVLGIPAGWALAQRRRPLWLLVLVALPLALPPSVSVSGWIGLLAPSGVASAFNMGFQEATRGWLFSVIGVSAVLAGCLWPLVALEFWPGFQRARNGAYEAALLYGSRTRSFFRVVLPQAKGEVAAGALLVFLLASSDFSVCSLLLVRTLPVEIHDALTLGKTASAAWASLPLLLMVVALAVLSARLHSPALPGARTAADTSAVRPGRIADLFVLAGISLGFALPLLVCLVQVLRGGRPMSAVFGAGTDALQVSVRMAGAAALLSIVLGILRLVFWPQSRARPINAACLILLTVPGSFLAAAFLSIQLNLTKWLMPGGESTLASALPAAILTVGYVARFSYIPLRLVDEGLAALDPDLMNAAAVAGHGRLSRAVSVALPLLGPHLAAGAALVLVLGLGEVAMADRLAAPGAVPATVWLFQQQHMGYDEAVFGLSLLLGALSAACLLLAGWVASALMRMLGRNSAA